MTIRIRTLVLIFNLILIIILILAGIVVAGRLTEARLIRQTELILLSEGLVLGQVVLDKMTAGLGPEVENYGKPIEESDTQSFLTEVEKEGLTKDPVQPRLDPIFSRPLELRDEWEKKDAPPPDPLALSVGLSVTPLLLAARESTLTGIRLVDWQGIVVGSTSGGQGRSLAHWTEVALALDGKLSSRIYQHQVTGSAADPAGRRLYRLHVAVPVVHNQRCLGAVVLIREPLNIELSELYRLRDYVILAVAALLVLIVFFAAITALAISLPLQSLLRRIERFSSGEEKAPPPLERPITTEIDKLARGFSRMAQVLEERSNYILTFARELTHAFKPSLATIRLRLEFLEDLEELSPEEIKRHLSIIEAEADRLNRKTDRALEWARADSAEPSGETTDVGQALNEIAWHFQAQNVFLELDLESEPLAAISPEDFEKIMLNLVDNSIKHGRPPVKITVRTFSRPPTRDGEVEITMADSGPGISEANRDKIFRTFFTTTPESGGTGLGLSIVRSLVKAHRGEITLGRTEGRGAVFIIRLPAAPKAQ